MPLKFDVYFIFTAGPTPSSDISYAPAPNFKR